MKTLTRLTVVIGMVVIGGLSSAAAEEVTLSTKVAGSFLSTRIDLNNDGILAGHSIL